MRTRTNECLHAKMVAVEHTIYLLCTIAEHAGVDLSRRTSLVSIVIEALEQ